MGSMVEDDDPEIEMQGLANSLSAPSKTNASDLLHTGAYSEFAKFLSLKRALKRSLKSINIVIMSAKVNLLLPFGPLSILLHYLTKQHVRTCHLRVCFSTVTFDFAMKLLEVHENRH